MHTLGSHLFFFQYIKDEGGIRVIANLSYKGYFAYKLGSAYGLVGAFATECGGGA